MAPPFDELRHFIDMKEIKLTRGQVAIVDDEDFDSLNKYKWYALKIPHGYYAVRNITSGVGQQKKLKMHRVVMSVTDPCIKVDHMYGDTLDNRKSQLRICSDSENKRNQVKSRVEVLTSKHKGLSYRKAKDKYDVRITIDRRVIHLGSFKDETDAAKAYNDGAIKYHGEFARLNIIED